MANPGSCSVQSCDYVLHHGLDKKFALEAECRNIALCDRIIDAFGRIEMDQVFFLAVGKGNALAAQLGQPAELLSALPAVKFLNDGIAKDERTK